MAASATRVPEAEPVPPPPAAEGRPAWLIPFIVLSAIWGSSFALIKVADRGLAPPEVAFGRVATGALALLVILAWRRERLPGGRGLWLRLAVAALLLNTLPFMLFAYGENRISSVLAGIWNATTPLLTLLAAMALLPDERPTRRRVAGLVVGFAGVLVVIGAWHGLGGRSLMGSLACLAAAACYGLGTPYARRFLTNGGGVTLVGLSAAQLLCATAELALVLPFSSPAPGPVTAEVAASVLVLGALGTGIAYVLYYGIVRLAGATIASTVTYVVPLFSTVAGVVFLGEGLSWNQPVGGLVVLAGVALAQGTPRLRRQ
jgi:drug/metabolite transporter (DMT)-like permease